MNFFNIGAGEFFLILVVLMIVLGPQRLPQLARQVGKAISDLRKFASEIDPELLQDFREISKDFESVRAEVTSLRTDLAEIQRDVSGAAKDVSQSLNEVVQEVQANTSISANAGAPAVAAASVAGGTPRPTVSPRPAAAPLAAAASAAAVATAAHPTGAGSTTAGGVASATGSTATAPAATAPALANATAAPALARPDDEIVGVSLPLRGPGDGAFLDEIMGVKVFPVPRSAARPTLPEPNGHDDQVLARSRHAVMASLSQHRQPPPRAASPVRTPIRPRTRERVTRRG